MVVVVRGGGAWVEPLFSISLVDPGVSLPSGVVLARRGTPLCGPLSFEVPGVFPAPVRVGGAVVFGTRQAYPIFSSCNES